MADLNYKSNSHKSKEKVNYDEKSEKRVTAPVVTGEVKTKKKSELSKFADVFVSEDACNVKNYILTDIIIPAVKNIISDTITNSIDMLLYGESGRRGRSSSSRVSYNASYRNYYDQRDDRFRGRDTGYSSYNYDEIILPTYGEAEEVLDKMSEILKDYGMVRVADLYELVGISGSYTDNAYGWTDMRNARSERVRGGGYLIKLPRPQRL